MPQGSQYKRRRLAGPKSPKTKMRYHFRWSPSPAHADLTFMDLPMTQTSPAEFQYDRRHTETYSTLRLSGAGHSRSSNLLTFDTKKWRYSQGRQAPKAGRHPRQARKAEANKYEQKKDTETPTHPYARTPGHPYGYPHVRQNSWFQILTFELISKN